jgi:hypothetical protein
MLSRPALGARSAWRCPLPPGRDGGSTAGVPFTCMKLHHGRPKVAARIVPALFLTFNAHVCILLVRQPCLLPGCGFSAPGLHTERSG